MYKRLGGIDQSLFGLIFPFLYKNSFPKTEKILKGEGALLRSAPSTSIKLKVIYHGLCNQY